MMKPKTIVLRVGGIKSLNSAFLKPLSRNRRSEMGSASILAIQPMNMPQKSEARVSRGSIRMHAKTRVATKNLYGGTRAARNRRAQKKPNSPNHSNTDMNKFLGKARRIRARLARALEMAAARTKIVRYINARTPGHCDEESPAALPTSGGWNL